MKASVVPYRLIAIDLDGTLLSSDHRVSDANIAAIQEARSLGLHVTLVSARPPFGMRDALDKTGLNGPLVAYNGAYVIDYHTNEVLVDNPIAKADGISAIHIIREYGLYTGYYSGMEWYVEKECPEMHWERRALKRYPHVTNLTGDPVPEAHKLIVADLEDHERLSRGYESMSRVLPELNIHYSGQHSFEVTRQSVSKGSALAYLSELMQIPPECFVAIGDNYNDLEMFSYAGLSIAMGNAPMGVQEGADWVVPSNDEDGVSFAIGRLLRGLA